MEDTGDSMMTVWSREDPREWSSEKVSTFVRSLGTSKCFQSVGDQVVQLGVDDSVFFTLSLNDLQGVCGHARAYDHMCEFTHNRTDARANSPCLLQLLPALVQGTNVRHQSPTRVQMVAVR